CYPARLTMRTPSRKILVVCLLAAGLITAVLCLRAPKAQSVRLADGSTLTLEFVSYQLTDSGEPRRSLVGAARRWLIQKLGVPTFARRAPTNSLVFWLSRRQKDTGKYMEFDWLSHVVAVDSHGCQFNAQPAMMVHSHNWAAGAIPLPQAPTGAKYILASGVLPAFPRREKSFKLRLFDRHLALVAEFDAPNPVYRPYPTWKPEDMPATHQNGDLTASLIRLENRWSVSHHDGLELKHFSLTSDFRLGEDGQGTDWELDDLEFEDATGNRSTADGPHAEVMRHIRRVTQGR